MQYKLSVLMHGIITGKCPDYLQPHRPASHFVTSRASFGGVPCAKVRHTATTHEVWRACLQLHRLSSSSSSSSRFVERITRRP